MNKRVPPFWGYDPNAWPELPPLNSLRREILTAMLEDELIQFSNAPQNADLLSAMAWLSRAGFIVEEARNGLDPDSSYGLTYYRLLSVPDELRAHIGNFYKTHRKAA